MAYRVQVVGRTELVYICLKRIFDHKQLDGTWHRHLQLPSSHRRYYTDYIISHEKLSENIGRANVCERNQTLSVDSYSFKNVIDTSVDNVITPIGVIELSTPKIDWFMKGINSSEHTEYLKECILNSTAIAVSDGSYFPLERVGACAWIVASNDGSE